ncbi:hypothetical protein ASPZODRAFT_73782 [Penicilliopsis zonata CBS 506.65]|uniref:Sacsin/Nov domain-containing protein n=1 Tax=Penicilliopsis zonata CBS 506.65 TaxID=1073090 RepID=A0A1L9S9E0_9EURO|nr:hypothetical protein ASPZODRAFT_73782 [Penicilliopsis zonata CBS 506.65]OJJ43802.1 hypothetical protein ASPZODRAFT_73782 [Penicilliopsis zonata CBS 506.65]
MSQKIDFNALKARTMGSGNDEEAVTVDTRGLISKVLARYSGKWTVLREMIQNAADASATRVTIKFETLPSTTVPLPASADQTTLIKHVLSNHTLKRLLISNNGLPFSEKDWSRLKRIADGNPDETKIGAFGVGFYSVFDDCEEPFVSSGDEAMAFYWKGNALFTRRLQLDEGSKNPETTFVLDYRNDSSPIPSLMQLCQFLSSSLTFVGLERIELWLDDWNLLRLTKKVAPSVNVTIPKDIETKTAQGLMKISSVTREVAQVDASWMRIVEWKPQATLSPLDGLRDTTGSLRSFFSRLTGQNGAEKQTKPERIERSNENEELTKILNASVFLHINTASIQASVSQALSDELERATRKPPPKKTKIAILTPSYDATIAVGASLSQSEILASILPSKTGRVFIGFPTHQTTGLNAHISAPSVIPTVERESIDLNTRYISRWNLEMLRAAGIICRIAWSAEMASIKLNILSKRELTNRSKIRREDIVPVIPEAIHSANQFVFRESTPSSLLGQTIEDAFWTCNKNASIEILSSCGVIQSHQTRIAPKELSFMDSIPVLPDEFVLGAKEFVKKLTDFGLVTDITVSDIKKELETCTLRSDQVLEFLSWLGRRAVSGQLESSSIQALLSVAVVNDEDSKGNATPLLVLADIRCFLNPQRIPAELPLPPWVMPFKFTKSLSKQYFEAMGWKELDIVPWLKWLVGNAGNRSILTVEQDMTCTSAFAAQVLPVLSKQWEPLSPSAKQTVASLLQAQTVIPTRFGMKRPAETYFTSVRLFDDLPIVYGLNNVKEKFLAALGVRKTVELGVIFERLLDPSESANTAVDNQKRWSHVDLVKYLTSVREDIPQKDIERLKNTSICMAEVQGDSTDNHRKRYKISELFEPNESLRNLNFPIIEWPANYRPSSGEGRFLTMLGLRCFPTAPELIDLMAQSLKEANHALYGRAISYFITEYHTNGYATFNCGGVNVPFLSVEGSKVPSAPSKCFTDEGAALFGFKILRKDLHPHALKFGVRPHPALGECIDVLIQQPPTTRKDARVFFKYLAGRVAELSARDISRVGNALVVPITSRDETEKDQKFRLITPNSCYLGEGEDYRDIFDFVDFGQEANLFLMAVGSKREPTKPELARMVVREPARISSIFQSSEKYIKLLRTLAEHLPTLRKDRDLFNSMRRSSFLLASRDITSQGTKKTNGKAEGGDGSDDDLYADEDQSIKEWNLAAAKEIIVVDDFQSFNLFKEHVLAAPQEEVLENFYIALGASPLSTIVEERAHWGAVAADQRPAVKLQKLIHERSRLFLHDQSSDSIRHDIKWLEKNLTVHVVNSISLTRSLQGRRVSHNQKRSAIITQQPKGWTLWICPGKYDLYEISQALVHLILVRPKLHSTLTLEMLLKTDLLELKARGYNVERILKQKAHEAKMAEDRRQKQVEEERKLLQEREAEWAKRQAQIAEEEQAQAQAQAQDLMPGDFPNSPTQRNNTRDLQQISQPEAIQQDQRPRGLFASLTKRLGLENGRFNDLSSSTTGPSEPQGSLPPPPYSADDPNKNRPEGTPNVHPPHKLHEELLSAVQACRAHGSSGVYSRPETKQVNETKSYCDEKPSHDLEFAATLPCGLHVLLTRSISDRSAFLSENIAGMNVFASVLLDCATIFALRKDSLSLFYDPGSKTIAFNQAGSIFCNYHYFKQLHQSSLLQLSSPGRAEALVYWWVILCHELAHNLVADHSSAHSYYTESFVAQYFPKIAVKLAADSPQPPVQTPQSQP